MQSELNWLLAFGIGFVLWSWSSKGRETVDRVSSKLCRDLDLQRLDHSVTLRRLRYARAGGHAGIQRIYSFEYSITGSDRHCGDVCLHNATPLWARLNQPDGSLLIDLS